jgi:hypothetical protein
MTSGAVLHRIELVPIRDKIAVEDSRYEEREGADKKFRADKSAR